MANLWAVVRRRRLFSAALLACVLAVSAAPQLSAEETLAEQVKQVVDLMLALDDLDFHVRTPQLLARVEAEDDPVERAWQACNLAVMLWEGEPEVYRRFIALCDELAFEHGPVELQRVAVIMREIREVTGNGGNAQPRENEERLEPYRDFLNLDEDLRAQTLYLLYTQPDTPALMARLESLVLRMRKEDPRGYATAINRAYRHRVQGGEWAIWRHLEAMEALALFAREQQIPVHRLNILYRLVTLLQEWYVDPDAAGVAVAAQFFLAQKADIALEQTYAYGLMAHVALLGLEPEKALAYVALARATAEVKQLRAAFMVDRAEAHASAVVGASDTTRLLNKRLMANLAIRFGPDEVPYRGYLDRVAAYEGVWEGRPQDAVAAFEAFRQRNFRETALWITTLLDEFEAVRVSEQQAQAGALRAAQRAARTNTALAATAAFTLLFAAYLVFLSRALRRAKDDALVLATAANAANLAKGRFVADMSHEIRTPMNAILGYSELLKHSPNLQDSDHRRLDALSTAGEHLLELINDVLEISKIEAGRMTENRVSVQLPSLLTDLVEMFRFRLDEQVLTMTLTIAEDVPDTVEVDGGKLRQILVNLLGNAVKFTEAGSIVVRVAMAAGDGDKNLLCIDVEDTGPGIAEEELSKVFASFEQTAAGRASGGGTGLGLSLSRDYARFLGGDIQLSSELGVGSTFRVQLRVWPSSGLDEVDDARRKARVLAPGQGEVRALVLDDEDASRDLAVRFLEQAGFLVHHEERGEPALQAAGQQRPQVVVIDCMMPELDGLEVLRRLREELDYHPVIVGMSASVEHSEEQLRGLGADGFLRKPFRAVDLIDAIEAAASLAFTTSASGPASAPDTR